ncbi:MAG TPA: L,D-transpeptidase [Flavipsychrobacter sp.]|nr:L,D-transpeptidase [Flavipsychrobacter sp.]
MKNSFPVLTFSLAFLLGACQNDPKPTAETISREEKPVEQPSDPKPDAIAPPVSIRFHALRMKDSGRKVFNGYSEEEQALILAMNRIDKANIWRPDTLIIPDTFIADRNAYSNFPLTVSDLSGVRKMVFFSYPSQTYAIYENGKLLKWGPTSMGKKSSKTPTGLFFTNWKGKEVRSTVDEEWILKWNFNISNRGGVGWHQYAMPGYPASHSCLRLYADEAKFLYDWADQWVLKDDQLIAHGTPVIVFGEYPFGQRRPWLNLLENPEALDISEQEVNNLVAPHLQKILEEQKRSEEVRNTTKTADTSQTVL